MEWDGMSLISPADTLELFVIRAEKSSQDAESYGDKKTKIQNYRVPHAENGIFST